MKKNKEEGLYNQLKNNPVEPIKYTKEGLIKIFEKLFEFPKNKDKYVKMNYYWVNNVWEENGQKYSSWRYTNGLHTMFTTGDGGKVKFDKILAEQFKETPKLMDEKEG